MNTIEKRLLSVAAVSSALNAQRGMNVAAPIIADWNAAAEAMKKYISDSYWRDGDEWQCGICHAGNTWHEEWHSPGTCHVAALQSVVARMNGLTPTDDVV